MGAKSSKKKPSLKIKKKASPSREEKYLEIEEIRSSPCSSECPLGTNVKAYISLIAAGKFSEALDVVRRTNPFPSICGRVCPHPCESECKRKDIDDAIAIAALKRFLTDYELRRGVIPRFEKKAPGKKTVAIIGAGPAGLTCAADCASEGYAVTVYEAQQVPGGMMALGIPAYRLPRDILKIEIDAVEALGVSLLLNTTVGRDISFEEVARRHDALFIATGAQKPGRSYIPGEDEITSGIINWVTLLKDAALNRGEKPGDSVVVVGGGNTAVDSARVALRLGAKNVTIAYRRTQEQMPAFEEEITDAREEGIAFQFLCMPSRLLHTEGKLTGVACTRMKLGKPDASGRPVPVPIENSEFVIPCDAIIPAIGQELDASFLTDKNKITVTKNHLIFADADTLLTSRKGVFAGGDAVLGASSIVEAIAAGHTAARSIQRYLHGIPLAEPEVQEISGELTVVASSKAAKTERIRYSRLSPAERIRSFNEINSVYTEAEAVAEAQRCRRCGPCTECFLCVGVCEKKQLVIEPESHPKKSGAVTPLLIARASQKLHSFVNKKGPLPVSFNKKVFRASVFTARVDDALCRGCGLCEEICGFHALRVRFLSEGFFTATVDEDMCRGCGTCMSVCPTGAIDQQFFTSEKLFGQIQKRISRDTHKIVYLTCRWSAPAEEVLSNSITVMCSGRISAGDILRALELGARKVILHGCENELCHYGFGCIAAENNMNILAETMQLLGMDKNRFTFIHNTKKQGAIA